MERFVKDPHTLRQKRQGPLCPHIDEFAQHRKGLVAAPVTLVERTTIDKLLDGFRLYLQQERVLAPTTVANYVYLIKKFLTHRFGTGPADLSDLTAAQVVGSVQRLVPSLCRKRAKVMTSALRSFLRYARYQDFIRSDLAACVPCVADWSVASIPKGLPIEHVKRVLASCNRKSAIGRRDYAILLLLARLGLRAGEVAALTLLVSSVTQNFIRNCPSSVGVVRSCDSSATVPIKMTWSSTLLQGCRLSPASAKCGAGAPCRTFSATPACG